MIALIWKWIAQRWVSTLLVPGLIVAVLGGLYAYHLKAIDTAVEAAKEGMVSAFELSAAEAKLAIAEERIARLTKVNADLTAAQMRDAEGDQNAQAAIRRYFETAPDTLDDCTVGIDLRSLVRDFNF